MDYPSDWVSVAEFLELEMTYIEFQMALLEMCSHKTYVSETGTERLVCKREDKLDAFIRHVFLPTIYGGSKYEAPSLIRKKIREEIEAKKKAEAAEAGE